MARKDQILGVSGTETVIGPGVTLRGNLHAEGDIIIEGSLDGDIKTAGSVTIGHNASVKSHIKAGSANIAGELIGDITVEDDINILASAKVRGKITAARLSVQSGAIYQGQISMTKTEIREVEDHDKDPLADLGKKK